MQVKEIEQIIRKHLKTKIANIRKLKDINSIRKELENIIIDTKEIKAIEVKEIETVKPDYDIGLTIDDINFEVKLKKGSCLII